MITNSRISFGDQLGAQMMTLANLIYLSDINNQKIVFWDELKDFRRGYQFLDVFECNNIRLIKSKYSLIRKLSNMITRINSDNWKVSMQKIYFSKAKYYRDRALYEIIRTSYKNFESKKGLINGVHCDETLVNLDPSISYDIIDGFGTYQDWQTSEKKVKEVFQFKKCIIEEGDRIFNQLNLRGLDSVSVHFRLADYLILASLNLPIEYYIDALKEYNKEQTVFLVFSDEIEKVKDFGLFDNLNVIFMDGNNSAAVDMYLMTKCSGGNIIANSTFSFWGGYLNMSPKKKIVCPKNFVGITTEVNYMNGNYYPKDWIAI